MADMFKKMRKMAASNLKPGASAPKKPQPPIPASPEIRFAPPESWEKIVREGAAQDRARARRNVGME